jgi:hypothetical protein
MRVKKKKLVLAFATTVAAMKLERAANAVGFPGRLIPVPREITAGCGLAFCTELEQRSGVAAFLQENQLVVDGIYEVYI